MIFKTLDRYLLKFFLMTLLVVTLSIGFIIIIINMVEILRHFIDNEVPLTQIVEYYVYFGGWVLKSFFPMFVLLSILFSVSFLARKNEILAMKAVGLSLYRIATPFIVVVAILAVGHFYYNEYIYPPANKRRVEIKEFQIKKRSKRRYDQVTNTYRQISPGNFYTIALFNVPRSEGQDFKMYKTDNNQLKELLTAQKIIYRDESWMVYDGLVRTFHDSVETSYSQFDSMKITEILEEPTDLAKKLEKPEDMGLEELQNYINMMGRSGAPHVRESIDLQLKYSYPLTSVIVVLLSIPFAANPRRGGIAVSFAVGAGIALVYFVLFRVLQSAGYNEKIPDYIAVWGINALFLLIGLTAMFRARK